MSWMGLFYTLACLVISDGLSFYIGQRNKIFPKYKIECEGLVARCTKYGTEKSVFY